MQNKLENFFCWPLFLKIENVFPNFSCMFLNPNTFSNSNSNCSNSYDLRNLQEQVKKALCHQKLFWPFTIWINCSSDLKNFANSLPSASNFTSFSRSLEHFFLTVGQNNFANKVPCMTLLLTLEIWFLKSFLTLLSITISNKCLILLR